MGGARPHARLLRMIRGYVHLADYELAGLAAGEDHAAYRELVRRAVGPVTSVLRRMGAQPALADDIAQDAFLAAWRSLSTYRGDSEFAGWVIRIAGRLYVKRIRREARLSLMAEPMEEEAPVPATSRDLGLDLDRAMESLSAVERLCVTLCHGAGLTHDEIARDLKIPVGTVKSHVRRGVLKLRERLSAAERQVAHG